MASGAKRIVLNLQEVSYVDSGGLGELVRSLAAVGRHGGSLKLINLTSKITDLLVITKLLTVFDSYDSEAAASAASSSRPECRMQKPQGMRFAQDSRLMTTRSNSYRRADFERGGRAGMARSITTVRRRGEKPWCSPNASDKQLVRRWRDRASTTSVTEDDIPAAPGPDIIVEFATTRM